MLAAKPSKEEENAFMKALLNDIDDSFFNALPSSSAPTPVSPIQSRDTVSSLQETPNNAKVHPTQQTESTAVSVSAADVDMAVLCEGAEEWDWNDMESDDLANSPVKNYPSPPTLVRPKCTRCEVVEVSPIKDGHEKRLVVKVDGLENTELREVNLTQDWVNTDVVVGDCINVLGEFSSCVNPSSSVSGCSSTITMTSRSNLLILHPDLLMSATTIANAPSCSRKPVISLMLASNAPAPANQGCDEGPVRSSPGEVVIWGNFLHEVMQKCMATGTWNNQSIERNIEEVVRSPNGLRELVKLGVGIEKARMEVRSRAGGLQEFSRRFMSQTIQPDGKLTDSRETKDSRSSIAITTLHEIEEDILSPTYGLKGKIDASVQVLIQEQLETIRKAFGQDGIRKWTLPFEIKTGRAAGVLEHRAQTMLYTLLMAERYGVDVPSGLLYYTQSEELLRVPAARNEVKALLMARNELASYIMRKRIVKSDQARSGVANDRPLLPSTIDDAYKCGKCYVANGCMLYRKAVENVEDNDSPISELYEKKTSHLTAAQCEFFKKWETLVSMEEQDVVRFRKELWTLTAEEREQKGRCFARMVLQDYKQNNGPGAARTHRHVYRFVRAHDPLASSIPASIQLPDGTLSLLNGSISTGDAATISLEPDLLCIARGFVIDIVPGHITIGFDHEVNLHNIWTRTRPSQPLPKTIVCRIDKDEFGSGLGRIRDNLARLFYLNGDTRRLKLVVDLEDPKFDDGLLPDGSELPKDLNINQQNALRKVLTAKDYALILGMPGTGKTTTIAETINTLVKRGKTVLLASYTHSAVDTILLKLKHVDYPILRLGSLEKVHPEIHKFTLAHQDQPTTLEQLENQILGPRVVATTCLSVDHPVFARRYFDYCIIDEASQVTLPTCLGPLRYADKFVLVGDHFQLPPLIRSRDARKGGLDISLFRRLAEAHPQAVVELAYQYRMNADIMSLTNELIYGGRLRCGSITVSDRALKLPNQQGSNALCQAKCRTQPCWISRLLDESCKVVFVDTDEIPAQESIVGELVQNETEAKLVCQVTEALLHCGLPTDQIGIISLYRQQVKLLSHLLHRHNGIEFLTADRSQGRDKDCIIISMVKSNDSGQVGELLKDWRRINVSFSRARSKLIIFGSRKTLKTAPVLEQFFELIESKGWRLLLEPGDDLRHQRTESPLRSSRAQKKQTSVSVKRKAKHENEKENLPSTSPLPLPKDSKKPKLDHGILRSRFMLRDVANDIS